MDIEMDDEEQLDRLVHLDLKGAPPQISYYEKLLPMLQRCGCTGLLVEYEDMFPYSGEFEVLASRNAYSKNEISRFQEIAESCNLKFIPLVQTFGHLEFMLKHKSFESLREVPEYPMALCPLKEESLATVLPLLEQVLAEHPKAEWLHIGADEVFHLGMCDRCRAYLKKNGNKPIKLFFHHVCGVLKYLREKHPDLKLIMWDDMFRDAELADLQEAGIGSLVEPMVWNYNNNIMFPKGMWGRYAEVFPSIWAASAFKGATGPCQILTNSEHHLENHRCWVKIMHTSAPLFKTFRGYAITGWQRYDHYSVLCELLPVGLPTLVMCLNLLKEGHFVEAVHKKSSEQLGFSELMPINPFNCLGVIAVCDFPGSTVFTGVQLVLVLLQRHRHLVKNDRIRGWLSRYNVQHKFCNPAHLKNFLPEAEELLQQMLAVERDLQAAMLEVFYPDAVDEWLTVNFRPKITSLETIVSQTISQIAYGARPKTLPDT